MATRTDELHSHRSAYQRHLADGDPTGLANGPFADDAPPSTPGESASALYLQESGDTSVIGVKDIHQGQISDCFVLSSIGEIALWHPDAITNMIHANADGTETVTLHLAANGQLPGYGTTSFLPTTVTLDNTFPSNA